MKMNLILLFIGFSPTGSVGFDCCFHILNIFLPTNSYEDVCFNGPADLNFPIKVSARPALALC